MGDTDALCTEIGLFVLRSISRAASAWICVASRWLCSANGSHWQDIRLQDGREKPLYFSLSSGLSWRLRQRLYYLHDSSCLKAPSSMASASVRQAFPPRFHFPLGSCPLWSLVTLDVPLSLQPSGGQQILAVFNELCHPPISFSPLSSFVKPAPLLNSSYLKYLE